MPSGWGGGGARPPTPGRPARAALTLSRSSGCVQQAAPQEASPPKYQRDTRASAPMAGRGRRGASAAWPDAAPDAGPDPDLSRRRNPRAGFKQASGTRAPRSRSARAARGRG